jgi:hypothetical protein
LPEETIRKEDTIVRDSFRSKVPDSTNHIFSLLHGDGLSIINDVKLGYWVQILRD